MKPSKSVKPMLNWKSILFSSVLLVISISVALGAGEIMLRMKNSTMTNYDIEMWRYAEQLKAQSDDPALDFDHVRSKSAILQNVEIRLNEWGLRGPPVESLDPDERRILFLGGSITLGWGVPEADTVVTRVQDKFQALGQPVQVLNGGVGNYNTERYVSRFFKELMGLKPTDIVVQYFLRDAEYLPPGGGNILLRNSELAVTLWIAYHRLFDREGEQSLLDHYRAVYRSDAPGFVEMQRQLNRLAIYAKENHIHIFLAMTPDVHNLSDYKFGSIHNLMEVIADRLGYTYIDLLPAMQGRSPQELWAMPGDPHPNGLGHQLMADAIFPVLAAASSGVGSP